MKSLEIKGARVRLGFNQQYMADVIGKSASSYQKKESGIVRFTDKEKLKIARVLQLTPEQTNDFLFDGELPIGK